MVKFSALKKQAEKAFLGTFWKTLTKKSHFLARAPPSKLIYIGTKGAFRKTLGSIGQKWIFQNCLKGGAFGSAGDRIPEGGGGGGERPAPHP